MTFAGRCSGCAFGTVAVFVTAWWVSVTPQPRSLLKSGAELEAAWQIMALYPQIALVSLSDPGADWRMSLHLDLSRWPATDCCC